GTYNAEREISKGVREEIRDMELGDKEMQKGLQEGNIKFRLYGKKLHGAFALVRTKGLGGNKEAWLLIKHRDDYSKKGYDAKGYDFSASTNRTLEEISKGVAKK
ncbi:MAG: DNA ligase, partial [Thaumarchaeota archaeon]|nr:DNA ligase [Nitrososphaerota archaeon]